MADPDDEDEGPELPLEGATCAVHGDRPAFRVCPACNANACLACWHPSISRCHACLVKDAKTFPPVPWEDRSRSLPVRFVLNALSALSPDSGAPGFARESDTTGAVFAVLTLVPFGLLSGIIPYTRTLLFEQGSCEIRVMGGADSHAIAMDVLVAAFTGLLVSTVLWLAVALPYVSLSRAYADRGMPTAAVRVMNYRGWLIPLFLTLYDVLPWCAPSANPGTTLLATVLAMIPLLLLLAAMRSVARMGSGAGPVATLAIVMVPIALMFVSQQMLEPLKPTPAEIAAALGSPAATAAPR